jgi:signal transduction histidine kinase
VTAAVLLPELLALGIYDLASRRAAAQAGLVAILERHLSVPANAPACLADPARFGGQLTPPFGPEDRGPPDGPSGPPFDNEPHGKPPLLWVYAADGTPVRADAPAIVPDQIPATGIVAIDNGFFQSDVAVVTRTGWGAPCAVLVLEGSTAVGWWGAVVPANPAWLLPLFTTVLGIFVTAGTVVERVRRLTRAVRTVAADGYRASVGISGDDELGELARAFDEAGRALQAQITATRAREEALRAFLANTSHDVLLPLTVLRGHLTAIRAQADAGTVDPHTIVSAMDEAHYLGSMLHNLAAVAQMDAVDAHLTRHPVDLGALVERVAARHRPLARQRGIEVHHGVPEAPLEVDGDVTLLEQALNNLAYNAVRYNHVGGNVALVLDETEGGFLLRVIDDGPGVPDALLSRLSERGFRADEARSRAPEGQGLGLAIVRRVADLHGFQLEFLRSEHGGLEARLTGEDGAGTLWVSGRANAGQAI